ncbi:MAG TPA: hypothetical protein VFR34_09440, partial [Paracoccaceae bacterium]|nr:hypothetical protein [Paracoccaceae bacterium]
LAALETLFTSPLPAEPGIAVEPAPLAAARPAAADAEAASMLAVEEADQFLFAIDRNPSWPDRGGGFGPEPVRFEPAEPATAYAVVSLSASWGPEAPSWTADNRAVPATHAERRPLAERDPADEALSRPEPSGFGSGRGGFQPMDDEADLHGLPASPLPEEAPPSLDWVA